MDLLMVQNKLEKFMKLNDFLLMLLAEECSEVSQRVCKSLRFGNDETQNGQEMSNKERLSEEVMDLLTIVDILQTKELIDISNFDNHRIKKEEKIEKYLKYSKSLGKVQ